MGDPYHSANKRTDVQYRGIGSFTSHMKRALCSCTMTLLY
jgi:hypothetical protein